MKSRDLLEKPFTSEQIKQRQGMFGDILDYVEAADVIQRLNDALDGDWSFSVLEHKVYDDEVIVLGKLSTNGVVKTQFGKSKITRSKKDQAMVSLGDDLKAAASDALKKCATLMGVSLHLYLDSAEEQPGRKTKSPKPSGDGRITARQLSAIFAIGKAQGMDNKTIKEHTKEVFNKLPDFLTRQEASVIIEQLQEGVDE
ncbi:RAD52 family DNA repair protein [Acidobacteria bacterium AH-259-A15]|nr:RAD52 family DNA repair protein [Acidobacteria bacterium AH-259-A15]